MTEEEKQILRDLKVTSVAELQAIVADKDALSAKYGVALATDQRINDYIFGVAGHPDDHNLYEILSVLRFFRLLDKYSWDKVRVKRFFYFYEHLRFSNPKGRRSYKLTPVQCFQFGSMFGYSMDDGRRLIRNVYLFVPRKYSKTTSAASLAVWDLLFGDANAQAYVASNSYQQSKICFDEIRKIILDLDPHMSHFKVNRETIFCKLPGRESTADCLANKPENLDGKNASMIILDESSQYKSADLKNVLTTSMGVRREPMVVNITTASDVLDGPFFAELEGVKSILMGEKENDTVFASLFLPDVDDAEDDPHTWRKVQPHYGVTVQKDYYEKAWQDAQISAANLMAFRTKLLNIFAINEESVWLDPKRIQDAMVDFNIDTIGGRPACNVAFDLSVHNDFSAVSYCIHDKVRKQFYVYTDYYFPEGALKGHPNEELYRIWNEQGHLKLLPGESIDVRHIANDILRRNKTVTIKHVGYDSYKAQDLVATLRASVRGDSSSFIVPVSQSRGAFNRPLETFEMLLYNDPCLIHFNSNPINSYCFGNCVLDEDNNGNKKPWKKTPSAKIDGAITTLMALGLFYRDD